MKHIYICVAFLCMLTMCNSSLPAQEQTRIGVAYTLDLQNGSTFQSGFGGLLERKLTKRSGVETGLYYRVHNLIFFSNIFDQGTLIFVGRGVIQERFLSIPLLYKFYSPVVNFAVGPSVDFFLGWRQSQGQPDIVVDDYSLNPVFLTGVLVKVSKEFQIADQWLIEPEFRYNLMLDGSRRYFGIIAGLRYILN